MYKATLLVQPLHATKLLRVRHEGSCCMLRHGVSDDPSGLIIISRTLLNATTNDKCTMLPRVSCVCMEGFLLAPAYSSCVSCLFSCGSCSLVVFSHVARRSWACCTLLHNIWCMRFCSCFNWCSVHVQLSSEVATIHQHTSFNLHTHTTHHTQHTHTHTHTHTPVSLQAVS